MIEFLFSNQSLTIIFTIIVGIIAFLSPTLALINKLNKKKPSENATMLINKEGDGCLIENYEKKSEKFFINIPYRNEHFFGREDILKTLFENTNTQAVTQSQVLYGLGGVGKSLTAIEYAHRNKDNYNAVLWINAESFASLSESYIQISKYFDIYVNDTKPEDIILTVNQVLYNFDKNKKWLVIFDNAENRQAIESYIPQGNGHVLITSRNPNWDKLASVKQIDVFTEDEALDFLADKIGVDKNSNEEDLKNLAKTLGYLPLALEQAGAYIKVRKKIIAEYIREFEEKQTGIFKEGRFNEKNYPLLDKDNNLSNLNVVTTWQISFEKIKEDLPETIAFLNLIAFLASNNIKINWFKDKYANIDNIIDILNEFSLIKQEKNNSDNISIHRLVQMVIRESITDGKKQKEQIEKVINIIASSYKYDYHKQDTWKESYSFIPHVEILMEYIEQFNIEIEQAGYILGITGFIYNSQGNYEKALKFYFKSLEITEKILGENHPSTATSYNNIGEIYRAQGNYEDAIKFYFKSLEITEKVLGENHPSTATSYNNIGEIYRAQGNYDEALKFYLKSLDIKKEVLGVNHHSTAASYNNIGSVYDFQGNYDEALKFYFKATDIYEKILGANHPDTAISYNNIGGVHRTQGNYEEALKFYFKSLEITEKALGVNHPSTATSYNNIGLLYKTQGNYDEAIKFYFKALNIREKVLGVNHPSTATSYNNIGSVYNFQGNYDEALKFYFKATDIYEKILGANHPDTAISYNNIGGVHRTQGNYDEAIKLYNKAYEIFKNSLGESHPNTLTIKENLEYINKEHNR